MSTAERTDPDLWDKVKAEITEGSKGGRKGEWSARKAQLAVQQYKSRGGRYKGEKRADNDLKTWTDEDWGTKSGKRSRDTGERYLPRKARQKLSDSEYASTTARKRADTRDGKQHSSQPGDVARKTARARDGGSDTLESMTKTELMDRARALDIRGRSRMKRSELERAISRAR